MHVFYWKEDGLEQRCVKGSGARRGFGSHFSRRASWRKNAEVQDVHWAISRKLSVIKKEGGKSQVI